MGKKRTAARQAAAAAALAATTTSPRPFDKHAAPSDVTAAPDAADLPANERQPPRATQPTPASAAYRGLPPAPPLVLEPAAPAADASATSAVADTSHTHDGHASFAYPAPCPAPPALATNTGVQHDGPAVSTAPPSVRHDTHAPPTPFLAQSTPTSAALATLAACVRAAGPPEFVVTTPTHACDDACDGLPATSSSTTSPESVPATHMHDPPPRLAMTREEIHPDLLAMIMEDGRRIERRAARLQPIDEEWKAAYQQGWHEGYEAGLDDGYSEVSPPPTTVRTDVGTQSDDPMPPLPAPASPHLSTPRVDAAVQANTPPRPPRMRADPHIPSPASPVPNVAVTAVQTDKVIAPIRVDSASQTADPADTPCRTALDSATLPHVKDAVHTDLLLSTPAITHSTHTPTIISTSPDDIPTLHASFTTHANDSATVHTTFNSFSWADDAAMLPVNNVTTATLLPTRDFSVLRTPSSRPPFESLQRRARRSRTRPMHFTRLQPPPPPQPLPVVTRHHPSGLRTGRPSLTIRSPAPMPMMPCIAPLDWDADPRLCELSRVLQDLGWVRSGSG